MSETPIYDAVCRDVSPRDQPEIDDESATSELSFPGSDHPPPRGDDPVV